jgi:GNAT superfamily N-acetyltransferase
VRERWEAFDGIADETNPTSLDAEAWRQVGLESLSNEPFKFGKAAEEHPVTPVETIALRFRDVPESNFYLGAFENEDLIGMATFSRETGLKERHKGHIYGFYLTSAQRHRGVRRALMTALLQCGRQDSSLEQILLAVAACQGAAKKLYFDFALETYGTEPNALKVGSKYFDEDHMILRIR